MNRKKSGATLIYVFQLFFILFGCTKPTFSTDEYQFPGLSKVQIQSDGSLSLQWVEIPSDDVKYYVYRKEKGQQFDWDNPLTVLVTNAFVHPAYSFKKQYCFAVRYTKNGIIPDENKTEICPELPSIGDFTGIDTAVSVQTGTAELSWKAPVTGAENISGYRIYKDAEFKDLATTATPAQSTISIPDLTAEQDYTFGVRVVDKYGREDDNTRTITVSIVNNSLPVFAGLLSAKKTGNESVTLTWPKVDGRIKEFRVYKATGSDNDTLQIEKENPFQIVSPTLLTATIAGLGDEQKHCFVVRAATSSGQEDINDISKCVTLPDNGPPVFDGVKTVQFGQSGVNLTWDEATGETKEYRIYYQLGSTINFSTASTIVVTSPANTGTVAGLLDNATYSFAVRAADSRGQVDNNTKKIQLSTTDVTPPNFAGYAGIVALDDTRIKVTFNRSVESDVSHYSIRYRRNGTNDSYTEAGIQSQVGSGTVEHTITGLLPATTYQVIVKVIDSNGNISTNSTTLTRQTLDLLPPSFSGISSVAAKTGDATRAVATWSAATDAGGVASYFVYYSKGSLTGVSLTRNDTFPKTLGGGQVVYISNAITSGTSTEFAGLDQGQNYFFVVHAVDNAGNEDANTAQATYSVPYYTAPLAPTSLGFNPSPSGPTANQNPSVTGVGQTGNLIRVYINGTLSASGAINSGTSFSVPLTFPSTTGDYTVTVTQVNPSGIEGAIGTAPLYQLLLTLPTAVLSGAPTNNSTNGLSTLNISVSNSANISHYKYALMNFNNISCGSATYSTNWISVSTPITDTLSADGVYRLCVIAKDVADNTQQVTSATQVDWTRNSSLPASAILSGGPAANSNALNLDVTVSGTDITHYKYVVVTGATNCVGATYGSLIAVATHITESTGTTDEARKLCVVGYNTYGNAQASPSQHTWNRKVQVPTISFFEAQDKTTSLGTGTTSPKVKAAFTNSPDVTAYCVKTTNTIPSAGDSCWDASSSPRIVLSGTTTGSYTIYGWVKDAANNVSTTSSDAITLTNYCDTGDLDNTCTVTGSKTIPSGTTLAGEGSLVVAGGALTQSAMQTMNINLLGDITVNNASSITGNVSIIASNVLIQVGGSISASGRGYTGVLNSTGNGAGGGKGTNFGSGCDQGGGGGSHAAAGGRGEGSCPATTVVYGSASEPTTYGSAGGASWNGSTGGSGGGAVKMVLSGTLTVSGTLTADGLVGVAGGSFSGGGGAGGSVWVVASSILGAGSITANGGSYGASITTAGAGSGGRISLTSSTPFHGTLTVSGGASGNAASIGSLHYGSSFCDSGSLSTTCVITGFVRVPDGFVFSGTGNLLLTAGSKFYSYGVTHTMSITMGGSITLQSGALITTNLTSVTGTSFALDTGANITLSGTGSQAVSLGAGTGTGGGAKATADGQGGGGGAHGGNGGNGHGGALGGAFFGSKTAPTLPGSAGGGCTYTGLGGHGGGFVRINVSGNVDINGTINVNGAAATGSTGGFGGGAGGSIWITAGGVFSGIGTLSANGGSANGVHGGGGGAGGRIAIDGYSTDSHVGSITVTGGARSGAGAAVAGASGSICKLGAGAGCIN